jgi:hypothetical protein
LPIKIEVNLDVSEHDGKEEGDFAEALRESLSGAGWNAAIERSRFGGALVGKLGVYIVANKEPLRRAAGLVIALNAAGIFPELLANTDAEWPIIIYVGKQPPP